MTSATYPGTAGADGSAGVPDWLDMFAEMLDEQRQFRIEQLADLANERLILSRVVASGDTEAAVVGEAHLQVIDVLAEGARSSVADIEAALSRLEDGTYGLCVGCGRRIAAERLEVLPHCRYCVGCQHSREVSANRR